MSSEDQSVETTDQEPEAPEPTGQTGAEEPDAPEPDPAESSEPGEQSEHRLRPSKARRVAGYKELARTAAETQAELRRVRDEMAQERANYATRMAAIEARTGSQPSEYETKIAKNQEELDEQMRIGSLPGASAEVVKAASAKWQRLIDERMKLHVEQVLASQPRQQAPDGTSQILGAEYPDVMGNDRYRHAANVYYQHLVANEGRPDGLSTAREAAAYVAAKAGLGGSLRSPSAADKARHGIVPNGGAGAGAAGGATRTYSPRELDMIRKAGMSTAQFEKWVAKEEAKYRDQG